MSTCPALLFTLILLAIVCLPWRVAAVDNIRIAYPSTSFTTMPMLAASKFGFYQQEGLRPELILMRPNISVTAVVTGQVEFATAAWLHRARSRAGYASEESHGRCRSARVLSRCEDQRE